MNINSAINQGVKVLKSNLIINPQLDSEILMAKTINKDRDFIFLNSNINLSKKDLDYFHKLIEKRSSGKPYHT